MPDNKAQQTTEPPVATTNKDQTEQSTSSRIDYYTDSHYDTDGNATLIDSNMYNVIYNNSELLFTSVTTKSGDVFYILVDYSDKDGQDNVYFLNKVDNYDLYSLLPDSTDESSYVTYDDYKEINKIIDRTTTTQEEDYYSSSIASNENSNTSTNSTGFALNSFTFMLIAILIVTIGVAVFFAFKSGIFSKKSKNQDNNEDDEYYDEYDDTDDDEI